MTQPADHPYLFIPGPVEVRPEILKAQATPMIGHRSAAFAELYARLQPKLQRSFRTQNRVYIFASSGTGVWEAASRNLVRDEARILHLCNGAFSDRWAEVSKANGKQVEILDAEWGQTILPEKLETILRHETYDAVACAYNETSTGVLNPVPEYAEILSNYPDTLFLVDAVSAYAGAPLHIDEWGIDLCLTSTQKAFALPPGMAFATVSQKALDRAATVANRGYYFDLLSIEKYHQRNNTPATPPIALMFAADRQLDDILTEGLENREARHKEMAELTRTWGQQAGFELFAQKGYESPTLTVFSNTMEIDIKALNTFLRERGMEIANGYGKIKNTTFRIAHMGDTQPHHLQELFGNFVAFLAQS
ncbi:MAG: alanine--glyoxylate aminotransferase family protein [Chloroflexi bacterium]|nr:alanine--glyoxylate aminotransferase family protein [Chloroflexota bacterium]